MKKKRSPKRRVLRRSKKAAKSKLTLEQVVKAAHEAGAKVSVSLHPFAQVKPVPMEPPERPRLNVPSEKWPGTPYNRTILASMNVTEKDIARAFKDNPSDRWVITPFEIVDRFEFFKPKPAPTPEGEQQQTNPS